MKTPPVDRGTRPSLRGWFHLVASFVGAIAGIILSIFAWGHLTHPQAIAVSIYCIGVVLLFGVSAAYHRGPWRSHDVVAWWRRADHSTIAVFIAATYTPLCALVLTREQATWMLIAAWVGAIFSVILNLVWITHPRLLGTGLYLLLGWLIIPLIPDLWRAAGAGVVLLLAAGGAVYTAGAVMYALKWPGRTAKYVGFHELFHAATIIAAALHMVAVWMVVLQAAA